MNQSEEACGKKRYQKPELRLYGDLRYLTATSTNHGKVADNITHGNKSA